MSLRYFMLYNISFLSRLIFSHYIVLPGSSLPNPFVLVVMDDRCFSPESGDGELEGMLVRKHEWESTTKKASNR